MEGDFQPLREIEVSGRSLDGFQTLVPRPWFGELLTLCERVRTRLDGRTIWNVSTTAVGGGVAEMLRSFVPYTKGLGVKSRWVVMGGAPAFFRLTKRLHRALHGGGDGAAPFTGDDVQLYEQTAEAAANALGPMLRPDDLVIIHDPQPAGMIPRLGRSQVKLLWRCHIGADEPDEATAAAWGFLGPYLRTADHFIFSRPRYIPATLPRSRCSVIAPTIDPFTPKNQELDPSSVRAILVHVGLVEGPPGAAQPTYRRWDGRLGTVQRCADLLTLGRLPAWDTPLVVQVSRWDGLKDFLGVLRGFATLVNPSAPCNAELVLAGPTVRSIADDPDGPAIFGELTTAWRALPHHQRRRILLANLPMGDPEENAAIVNALQRHATVIVQKSLKEGFGLTVTEAMWKGRAVLASAAGGIQEQITDGVDGLLLRNPKDTREFAETLRSLLEDAPRQERLGESARTRILAHQLTVHGLWAYGELLERLA